MRRNRPGAGIARAPEPDPAFTLALSGTTPQQQRAATRYVASCAADVADLALLLDALGLSAATGRLDAEATS